MSGGPEDLILTYLRRIDTKVDDVRADMAEVKQRLGFLEEQYASISRRVDRIGGDVERIKTRLDLVDAPVN
jgi:archaellum component FlaC